MSKCFLRLLRFTERKVGMKGPIICLFDGDLKEVKRNAMS